MSRKFLLSLTFCLVVGSAAQADPVEQQVEVNAHVAGYCTIDDSDQTQTQVINYRASAGLIPNAEQEVEFVVQCNGATSLSFTSLKSGMVDTPLSTGISYDATAEVPGAAGPLTIDTTLGVLGSPTQVNSSSLNPSGLAKIKVKPHAGQTPPAGDYSDLLALTITPPL